MKYGQKHVCITVRKGRDKSRRDEKHICPPESSTQMSNLLYFDDNASTEYLICSFLFFSFFRNQSNAVVYSYAL